MRAAAFHVSPQHLHPRALDERLLRIKAGAEVAPVRRGGERGSHLDIDLALHFDRLENLRRRAKPFANRLTMAPAVRREGDLNRECGPRLEDLIGDVGDPTKDDARLLENADAPGGAAFLHSDQASEFLVAAPRVDLEMLKDRKICFVQASAGRGKGLRKTMKRETPAIDLGVHDELRSSLNHPLTHADLTKDRTRFDLSANGRFNHRFGNWIILIGSDERTSEGDDLIGQRDRDQSNGASPHAASPGDPVSHASIELQGEPSQSVSLTDVTRELQPIDEDFGAIPDPEPKPIDL